MAKRTCIIPGCDRPRYGHGYCQMHWKRWRKGTDLYRPPKIVGDDEARFWSHVNKDGPLPEYRPDLGPCWVWTRATTSGYGVFRVGGLNVLAYRWAYERYIGPIPEGLEPDHLCRVRACVNYERHLEPVTHQENNRRGESPSAKAAKATHCPQGHPYDAVNTGPLRSHGRLRGRRCRTCHRERERARYRAAHGTSSPGGMAGSLPP